MYHRVSFRHFCLKRQRHKSPVEEYISDRNWRESRVPMWTCVKFTNSRTVLFGAKIERSLEPSLSLLAHTSIHPPSTQEYPAGEQRRAKNLSLPCNRHQAVRRSRRNRNRVYFVACQIYLKSLHTTTWTQSRHELVKLKSLHSLFCFVYLEYSSHKCKTTESWTKCLHVERKFRTQISSLFYKYHI